MDKGYSFIELLIVTAVLAISLTVAVPAFSQLSQNIRADTVTSRWISTLNFARQYAQANTSDVVFCPIVNDRCNFDLHGTWTVFSDANNNQIIDSQDTVLRVQQLSNHESVSFYGGSARFFRFQNPESGVYNGHMRGFTICPSGKPDHTARHLTTNIMGRVSFREVRMIDDVAHVQKSAGWVAVQCQ